MRGILSTLVCLSLFAAAFAMAADPQPLPAVNPGALPIRKDAGGEKLDLSVEHLLKAAEHLEAAGMADEASKLRSIARQRAIHDSDLSRKEAELECLQEEVDRLRALTGQAPGVVIEFVALEVQRGKLGLKAQEFDKMIGLGQISPQNSNSRGDEALESRSEAEQSPSRNTAIIEANPARLPLFKELREKGVIRVLAEPTLVTTSKRPANFLDGGQIPVPLASTDGRASIGYKTFGTQIEVVAAVLANQHLRLQTTFEFSEINQADAVVVEGTAIPGITTRRINTEVEMRLGQTLTIGRLVMERRSESAAAGATTDQKNVAKSIAAERSSSELVETLIFITPRLFHGQITPQPSQILPTAATDEPGVVLPADGSFFGPPVPVLKRRPVRK